MSKLISITRRFEFDAAHRVYGHESKCANLHGHRYVALVTLRPKQQLDELGRVIDFSVVKQDIGKWIDDNWDHNILLNSEDPLALMYLVHQDATKKEIAERAKATTRQIFGDKAPYIMAGSGTNPTAENMAKELFRVVCCLLPTWTSKGYNLIPTRVRLYETPNCYADYAKHGEGCGG